jgi:hypothetical protein
LEGSLAIAKRATPGELKYYDFEQPLCGRALGLAQALLYFAFVPTLKMAVHRVSASLPALAVKSSLELTLVDSYRTGSNHTFLSKITTIFSF